MRKEKNQATRSEERRQWVYDRLEKETAPPLTREQIEADTAEFLKRKAIKQLPSDMPKQVAITGKRSQR
jgi:hypothetical protein